MRRNGNLPNFVTKYCVPRYGTSFEAEHRHERADEFLNDMGQVKYNWTISEDYFWCIFSNLGFIGAPWTNLSYEEDYSYRWSDRPLRGGYFLIDDGAPQSRRYDACFIETGTSPARTSDASMENYRFSTYNPRQLFVGGWYFYGDQRHDVQTSASSREMFDDVFAIRQSGYMSWGSTYLYDRGQLRNQYNASLGFGVYKSHNSYAGYFVIDVTILASALSMPRSGILDWRRFKEGGASIVSYDDYNIVSLKDSLGLGIGDDETPHVWQIACNHFILGTSPYGVWQGADGFERDMTFRLGYFPPDAKSFVTAETTTVGRRTLTLGRSSSDCFAIVQDLNSNNYTLYYELERLMEDQSELPNVGFFGTCYVNFDTKEVTDAQSGEQWSLDAVLSITSPQDVRAYSSGKTGVLLRFAQDDNEWYFVSKNSVFQCHGDGESVYLFDYPNAPYRRECIMMKGNILYRIQEDRFFAYDMQTFLRLDDLPGFQSAVEKVWERA